MENFFQRIERHRRVATRHDKLAKIFFNFILLASTLDWLGSRGFFKRSLVRGGQNHRRINRGWTE